MDGGRWKGKKKKTDWKKKKKKKAQWDTHVCRCALYSLEKKISQELRYCVLENFQWKIQNSTD